LLTSKTPLNGVFDFLCSHCVACATWRDGKNCLRREPYFAKATKGTASQAKQWRSRELNPGAHDSFFWFYTA